MKAAVGVAGALSIPGFETVLNGTGYPGRPPGSGARVWSSRRDQARAGMAPALMHAVLNHAHGPVAVIPQ